MVGEPRYSVTESKDVLVPTHDGTNIAANLLLPAGAGPVPAIVVYSPYLKDGPIGRGDIYNWQFHFTSRGYACLIADIRGTGASEGRAVPAKLAVGENDARDLLAWPRRSPGATG